jgi:hypothetical protein
VREDVSSAGCRCRRAGPFGAGTRSRREPAASARAGDASGRCWHKVPGRPISGGDRDASPARSRPGPMGTLPSRRRASAAGAPPQPAPSGCLRRWGSAAAPSTGRSSRRPDRGVRISTPGRRCGRARGRGAPPGEAVRRPGDGSGPAGPVGPARRDLRPAQPQAECLVRRDARHRYQNGRRVACLL